MLYIYKIYQTKRSNLLSGNRALIIHKDTF